MSLPTEKEQLGWAMNAALLVRAPERAVLAVTGSDRLTWLNGLLTCDLAGRRPGDVIFGLAVAQKGKIISDVIVIVEESRALLVVQRAAADTLTASFDHHLMMEDAELSPVVGEVAFIHGPRAGAVLEAARRTGATGGPFDASRWGGAVVVTFGGDGDHSGLARAASSAGGGEGTPAGWELVRVVAGVPRFGVDFDDATYPQEAGLETKAVSFQKGCYLGQEVVCMLEMRGHVKKKLVALAVAGGEAPPAHTALTDVKGVPVGEITSAVRTPDGDVRALAMVKYAFITQGTELNALGRPARVV